MVEKDIDGHKYQIVQFMTTKSLEILENLGEILGEPLASAMALATTDSEDTSKDFEEAKLIGDLAKTLFKKSKEHGGINLIKKLLAKDCLLCDGKPVDFETHFQGELPLLIKVLTAVLGVQYGNFLKEISGYAGIRKQTETTQPQSSLQ